MRAMRRVVDDFVVQRLRALPPRVVLEQLLGLFSMATLGNVPFVVVDAPNKHERVHEGDVVLLLESCVRRVVW